MRAFQCFSFYGLYLFHDCYSCISFQGFLEPPPQSCTICYTSFLCFYFPLNWVFFKLKASMKLLVIWSVVFSSSPPRCALHVTLLQKDQSLHFCLSGRGCVPGLCRIRLRALRCKPHSASPQLLLHPLHTFWKFLHCFLSSASPCPLCQCLTFLNSCFVWF